jgi:AraC-like DNA-binding protein
MIDPSRSIRRQEPARIEVPAGQVRVLESHHASDFQMVLDKWPFHKLCWVAIGRGMLESAERRVAIRQDDFLLLPANWEHRFVDQLSEPLTLVILCISKKSINESTNPQRGELWERSLGRDKTGEPRCARTAFHHSGLVEAFRLALREQGNQRIGWEIALQVVADRLLLSFGRNHCELRSAHESSSAQTVDGAIEYLDTHVYEPLLIDDMAKRCHLSPRRFTDLFKQQTGQTFNSYLNKKRIEYACQRLDETGHILYACHESGYNDLAYFYRVFKKAMGLTPGQYLEANSTRR